MNQTLEPKWDYEKHSGFIKFDTRLRICKYCGELYLNITEVYKITSGQIRERNCYNLNKEMGDNPFITHLVTKHNHMGMK
jgi:hypothetical protein